MIITVIFTIVVCFVNVDGSFLLPAVSPGDCSSDEYFDSVCISCKPCGKENGQEKLQQRASDGSCICKSQYKLKERKSLYNVLCESCPHRKVPSINGPSCLSCDEKNPFNETLGTCEPCIDGIFVETGEIIECIPCNEKNNSNSFSRCASCTADIAASPEICASKGMVLSGGQCIPIFQDKISLYTIKFENGISVKSSFFTEHLNTAYHNCEQGLNATACQVLANMCVMIMYKLGNRLTDEDGACSEFMKVIRKINCPVKCLFSEQCIGLWLYYINEDAGGELYKDNVPNSFSTNPASPTSELNIVAMKHDLNGNFVGMSSITSDDLHICPKTDIEKDLGFSFGTRIEKNCKVNLKDIWDKSKLLFYDLFLASDNKTNLYPIPVLIRGLRENGELVNTGNAESKWQLVRRFFLSDHISGIEVGSNVAEKHNQPIAKVFRYAADVMLKITLRPGKQPGSIYPPLLIISYEEATPDDYMKNKRVTVKFSVSYEMNQSSTTQGIAIAIGVLSVLAFAWSCVQTWSWYRRSGKQAVDLLTLGKFITFMCGNIATVFFVVIFCACLNWLMFFKKQDVMHLLLPTLEQEKFLGVYLGIAFAMKAIQVIHLLSIQCTINIFFIDWERPRGRAPSSSSRVASSSKAVAETIAGSDSKKLPPGSSLKVTPDKINAEMAGVSIWRTYFAANEWSEIQSKRKINLSVQLFGVLFFLKVEFTFAALIVLKIDCW